MHIHSRVTVIASKREKPKRSQRGISGRSGCWPCECTVSRSHDNNGTLLATPLLVWRTAASRAPGQSLGWGGGGQRVEEIMSQKQPQATDRQPGPQHSGHHHPPPPQWGRGCLRGEPVGWRVGWTSTTRPIQKYKMLSVDNFAFNVEPYWMGLRLEHQVQPVNVFFSSRTT